ncbi:MAG TPA: response regulator transcription factor [Terracidiphilus sp.]|nr:response regulator transcription factor [Terracidiphilus sp.]
MATMTQTDPIRVGVPAGEPIRLEGLTSVFERKPEFGQSALLPVVGELEELLSDEELEYLVVDLNSSIGGLKSLPEIRRRRPGLRLIVIGPPGNDELVLDSIIGGARAYLDSSAGPRVVREAIEVVVSGSIWAPRRLLSKLIDRLLSSPESGMGAIDPHLTARERQVLDLILLARSNREIARELGIEERTVKAHVGRLMRKTGAENRIDLSMRALHGALGPKPPQPVDPRAGKGGE